MFCAPNLGEWFDRPIKESDLDIESDLVIVIKESAPSVRQLSPEISKPSRLTHWPTASVTDLLGL
jgi:hypothetical protein